MRSAIVAGILVCAALASGCKSKAQKAKELAEAPGIIHGFKTQAHAIHQMLPAPSTLEESACDAAAIGRVLPQKSGIGPARVDRKFFEELEGGPRRAFGFGNVFHERWDFLVSTWMQLLIHNTRPGKEDLVDAAGDITSAREHGGNALVVLLVEKVVEPKSLRPASAADRFFDKKSFSSGEFEAWAVVYALEGPKQLCQAHVSATNSDNVSFKSGKLEQALADDFKENIQKEIDASLKRISPRLRATF